MKKYDEYKDSGVAWIGDVPKHWEVIKTSLAFQGIGSGTTPSTSKKEYYDDNGNGKYWLQTGDLEDGIVYDTSKKVSNIAIKECNLTFYPIDSIIIAMYGATIGKVGILGIESATNQACCVIPVTKKQIAKYFFYEFLACKPALLIAAIGGGQPNISQDTIKKLKIVIPPINEQTAIATYLDTHCAKIDNLISIQQKRIALLQELKQSVITHAVTKGLNPNVEMKQSGVEWIGDVPKHWELVRTRYLCNLCTGSKDTINRVDDGKYPFYVRSPKVERINTYSFDGEAILMAGDGVGAGKVFHYAVGKFDYHQRVYNFHNFKHVLGKFFYNYISNNFKYIIEEGGAKNTVDSVRLYMIQNFMTTVPPLEEQMEICNYIEQKEKVFDTSISNAQHQIELLQEYKQSLITEVVTGKRKVTDN